MTKLKTLAKTGVMQLRKVFRRFDLGIKRAIVWPFRKLWRFKKLRRSLLPLAKIAHQHHRIVAGGFAGLIALGVFIPVWQELARAQRYALSNETIALVGSANQNITSKIEYNPQTAKFEFNGSSKMQTVDGVPQATLAAQTGGGGENSEQQYSVDVSRSLRDGVTYYENNLGVNFTLKPQFAALGGEKVDGGRLLYPLADGLGGQLIYTANNKGLKEDVVLHKKPTTDEVVLRYELEIPDSLEARLLDSGELGIYSADPTLYGNIQYGTEGDREVLEKARANAEKSHLAFTIPAPYVVGLNEQGDPERAALSSRFLLSDDKSTLSVVTNGFAQTDESMYPLSIDPSVTVTSTSDFTDRGMDEDNNLTIGTDQITRKQVSGGAVGTWSTTTVLSAAADYARPVAYGGRMYVMATPSSGNAVLRYATINSNGTLGGSWTTASNQPSGVTTDMGYEFVLYGGRLYFIGGGAEKKQVEYATIQADGSVGTWQTASTLQQSRQFFGAVAYGGYLYAAGTVSPTTAVEYAAIKADGSLGPWQTTESLPSEMSFGSMVAYNGRVYYLGTATGAVYANIGDNGTLGSWTEATAITNGPQGLQAGVTQAGGYVYIVGGYGVGAVSSGQVNYGQITADGNVNPWRLTTSVGTPNTYLNSGAVAYNGYLYAMGGSAGSGSFNTVRYAPIKTAGDIDQWTASTTMGIRNNAASVVYNSYLYLLGGQSGTTGTALTSNMRIPLNADGTLGTAVTSTSTATGSFATATRSLGAFAYNGYMYAIGGTNAAGTTYLQTVQRSPITAGTGALGAWSTTGMTQLSSGTGRWGHGVAFYNNRIYISGGRFNASSVSNAVLYTTLSTAGVMGASWTGAGSNFSTARVDHQFVQYGGYLYILGGWNGTTVYADVQYAKINTDGTITSWTTTESLFGGAGVYAFGAFAANGYLYAAGGALSSGTSSTTAKARITANGSLAVWEQIGASGGGTVNRAYGAAAYANGYAYYYGGIPSTGGSGVGTALWGRINNGGTGAITAQTTTGLASQTRASCIFVRDNYIYAFGNPGTLQIKYAQIVSGGNTVGSWATMTPAQLPEVRTNAGCAMDGARAYLVGGQTTGGTLLSSTIYTTIEAPGVVAEWQTAATSLPTALRNGSSFARNGYLYFMGGETTSTSSAAARRATINSDGNLGSWSTVNTLFAATAGAASVVVDDYVYLLGGTSAPSTGIDTAQVALIQSDGTLGDWTRTSTLPAARSYASATASNGYLYVTGGNDSGNAATDTVYYTAINADGGLDGWQTTTALPAVAYGHTSFSNGGRIYTVGINSFGSNTSFSAGMDIQTRRATYSKVIDVGAIGSINSISFLGTFSSITNAPTTPAVTYQMAGTSGAFGSTRQYWDVDGGGALDICIAAAKEVQRYVRVQMVIDDSSAAQFSDAAANNATAITSVTVDYEPPYRAPTELRMRGGKWFYGEQLQAMDVCGPVTAGAPGQSAVPQYVGWSSNGLINAAGTAQSVTVPLPSNSRGFMAVLSGVVASSDITVPTGWSEVTTGQIGSQTDRPARVYLATSETPGTVWQFPSGVSGVSIGVTGYDVPVEISTQSWWAATEPRTLSVTTAVNNVLVARVISSRSTADGPIGYPNNATIGRNQRYDYLSAGGWATRIGIAHNEQLTPGATGSALFTVPGTTQHFTGAFALVRADG